MVGAGSTPSGSSSGSGIATSEGGSQPPPNMAISDTSLQIMIHKVNGRNYLEWAQSVRLVIHVKGKLGYLNGEVKTPSSTDAKYKQRRSENSMVTACLIIEGTYSR